MWSDEVRHASVRVHRRRIVVGLALGAIAGAGGWLLATTMVHDQHIRPRTRTILTVLAGLLAAACTPKGSMNDTQLTDFATRYAAAWSSRNPDSLAECYAQDGSLTVNAGTPSVGRAAIRATANGFMSAFPDMIVRMDSVVRAGPKVIFHWTWTGTNTGPGGTGKPVHISGYEEWTFGPDGLISQSLGHFDEAEYQRQITAGS